jgi:hypothetical protein
MQDGCTTIGQEQLCVCEVMSIAWLISTLTRLVVFVSLQLCCAQHVLYRCEMISFECDIDSHTPAAVRQEGTIVRNQRLVQRWWTVSNSGCWVVSRALGGMYESMVIDSIAGNVPAFPVLQYTYACKPSFAHGKVRFRICIRSSASS